MVMRCRNDKNEEFDKILKVALTIDQKPKEELNQYLLEVWKEKTGMKKSKKRGIVIAVAAACMILATGSVLAVANYMRLTDLADKSGIETMKNVFSGEDVTEIYETREAGEYRFTLMGIASGEVWGQSSLSEQVTDLQGTYAALAVERLDGVAMPDTSEDAYGMLELFISPLIEGLKPWQYNIASMNGGYVDIVEDGILYRLIECDSILPFADRELYLCVSDTSFYDTNAYHYDEKSGKVSRNEEYSGINLLFSLPVDISKANQEVANAYLEKLEESWKQDSEEEGKKDEQLSEIVAQIEALLAEGRNEEALEAFVAVGEPVLITPEENGEYRYECSSEDQTEIFHFYQEDFQNGQDYMILISYKGNNDNEEIQEWKKINVIVLTENEDQDGTVTAQRYEMENK